MEDLETIIMELLVNAGSARSAALTALQLARKGDFAAAEQAMAESHEFIKFRPSLSAWMKAAVNCRST